MSSIAIFTLLPKSGLPGLRDAAQPEDGQFGGPADRFHEFLAEHGREIVNYDASGYVLATLLPYLDGQGIDLTHSEYDDLAAYLSQTRESCCYIFTGALRDACLARLDVESFSEAALRDYFNEFNACNEPETGIAMLDGIRVLHESLRQADEESVIFFQIS